ncbi:DUF6368 family protein [Streptomyces genisteinicus]|uniref:Uncharacterized protein n=1 Tax=Streptomyces genisteinicus TaxID=2768068 RepID=A0A7H0I0G8_9ACTN|nr:DUF6368 family protein [Streptomyces genisteinicus]QNP66284.1 hypothetical protein IAG43_27365 [Streptomyces genisteinicus]
MSGPTLVVELAEPVSPGAMRRFRALMHGLSSRCEERRPGWFDAHVHAGRLGIGSPDGDEHGDGERGRAWPRPLLGGLPDGALAALAGPGPGHEDPRRPFDVYLMGPGVGDEGIFEAEHADSPEVPAVLGFTPTHAVNVSAACNRPVDHLATALLTAAVMDAVGGVACAELRADQVQLVSGLPGVLGLTDDEEYPSALGSAGFLRAWAARPGFRLLK